MEPECVRGLVKTKLGECIEIKKIASNFFLISFLDEILKEKLKVDNWRGLSKFFEEIDNWSYNLGFKTRTCWVSCMGVPLHLWNLKTFQSIGNA